MFINNEQFAYSDEYDLDRLAERFYQKSEHIKYARIANELNQVVKRRTSSIRDFIGVAIYIDKVTDTTKVLNLDYTTKETLGEMIVEHEDEITDESIQTFLRQSRRAHAD